GRTSVPGPMRVDPREKPEGRKRCGSLVHLRVTLASACGPDERDRPRRRIGKQTNYVEVYVVATLTDIYGVRYGLNVDNLEVTTDEEIDAFLNHVRRARGPLDPGPQYEMRANAMWLHTRPDFAKLHMRVLDAWHTQG